MKKLFFTAAFLLASLTASYAQFSVGYHQSNLPFVSLGYEIKGRLLPELRLSTDIDLDEYFSPELVLTYQFINKQYYEVYAGLGYRVNAFQGAVFPVGLNLFPFNQQKFGFHIEVAPLIEPDGAKILRGSWGIRYRFARE